MLGKEKTEQLLSSLSHHLYLSSSHPSISPSTLQKALRLCEFNVSKSTNVIRFTDSRESENPEVCARPPHPFRQEFQNATDVVWQTFLKAPIEASKKKDKKRKKCRPRLRLCCRDLFDCVASISAIFSSDRSPVVSEIAQEESYAKREAGACFSGLSGSRAGDGSKLCVLLLWDQFQPPDNAVMRQTSVFGFYKLCLDIEHLVFIREACLTILWNMYLSGVLWGVLFHNRGVSSNEAR